MRVIGTILAAILLLLGIIGCSSESRKVTMHKPGIYKGTRDPFSINEQQRQTLIDRFKLVQTDR